MQLGMSIQITPIIKPRATCAAHVLLIAAVHLHMRGQLGRSQKHLKNNENISIIHIWKAKIYIGNSEKDIEIYKAVVENIWLFLCAANFDAVRNTLSHTNINLFIHTYSSIYLFCLLIMRLYKISATILKFKL